MLAFLVRLIWLINHGWVTQWEKARATESGKLGSIPKAWKTCGVFSFVFGIRGWMGARECFIGGSGVRRKLSWGGVHSVDYGGHLYLVCALCDVTIWRHIHASKPTFWWSLLTWYTRASTTRIPLILCIIALDANSQLSKLRYRRKINSTLRQSSS